MESLQFTSLMAQNSEFIADTIVRYIDDGLDLPAEGDFVIAISRA